MKLSPIIIFAYSRVNHIKRLFNSLSKNYLYNQSKIYVFSDAAKDETTENGVIEVRRLLRRQAVSKNISIIERKYNLGLSENIIKGLNEIFTLHDKAIILEDDLEVSVHFLKYMNDALEIYKNSKQVCSVSGYMYPINPKNFSSNFFFLKLIESWGWGTWKRSWRNMELNPIKLKNQIESKERIEEFNLGQGIKYYQMLLNNISKKNNSWAVRWYGSNFLKNMLTLFPDKSFVRNIGIDGSGIHCGFSNTFDTKLSNKYNKINAKEIKEIYSDREQIKNFFEKTKYKRIFQNITGRIKNFIKA